MEPARSPPPSVSNLQSCLAPVFDLYGEQSESGKYKCGISFSNRIFGTFHHLSPYRKSFGNFVQRRHCGTGFFVVDRVRRFSVVLGNDPAAFWPSLSKKAPPPNWQFPTRERTRCSTKHRARHHRAAPHDRTQVCTSRGTTRAGPDRASSLEAKLSSGKKDVCVEATNGPPRGRLRDGPARVHRGSRAIHRAPTRPRLRRGHRADWKGAFHPATSTHRAPRPASSSEPIQVNLVHSASFRKPSLTPDMSCSPFRDRRSDSMRSPPSTTRRVRPTSSVQSA